MDEYNLDREDWESVHDIIDIPGKFINLGEVAPNVKAAFTKK